MKETPKELRFFRVILKSIADGVFTVDESRIITSFNPAAERITGIPASRAVGKKCYDVFHSDICEKCLLEKTLKTGIETVDRPVNILNSQGEEIPISISTAVLRDDDGQLLGAVETFRDLSAIENLRKELNKKYSFEDIISKSPHITKLFSILPDVAESESTVLIQGASGTGKELFARAIHNISPRKEENYVVINCGTLPVQLFESELFGYVKGAFTDARRDKPGKLARAHNGTVFFDEIGELPLSTQVKLLRLLQNHEYEPLGSTEQVKSNIRIIAATNQNLKKLVAQGKFRDDLYFRLAVVKFELPPLTKRREDIPYLVDHFIKKFNSRRGKNIVSVSPTVMNILMRYDFPGNIRELENIIEYGFVVCRGSTIQKQHLPGEILSAVSSDLVEDETAQNPVARSIDEEIKIKNALEKNNGHLTRAASDLGIHRTTLWRRLKRFNINPDEYKFLS
ncbi:MAG: PAS domain S-box protein [candidate division Zixibacteria bacterium]|nr:PAS domain S-box protein [candidate division Zixibacteria bacterium]